MYFTLVLFYLLILEVFGNGLTMGSKYITFLLPCLAELSEPFVTVVSPVCASVPSLVSKSLMIGSSSLSMIIGFISFLTLPTAFVHSGVHVSDGLVLFAL